MRFSAPIFFLVTVIFISCRKDRILTDSSARLSFSTDTLTFDTVFTTVGSTTEFFRVFNPNKRPVRISGIRLAGGTSSQFRMNIDGMPAYEGYNYEIAGGDSMYVFVEVTVDPNIQNTPYIIMDSILFETNGNRQQVILAAWGQNAHFYNQDSLCNVTWTNDKPYVVFNYVMVKSGCTLTIEEGVQVHMHPGSLFIVNGTLIVNGKQDTPVTFLGDRLEHYFDDLPGQWGWIHFARGSVNNQITHAVIKNSIYGIRVDSLSENMNPNLVIKQSVIKNILGGGILSLTGEIDAENCLIINCGQNNLQLVYGGNYNFRHCTFANYSSSVINHRDPVLLLSNYIEISQVPYYQDFNASFTNCIIYGGEEEELGLAFGSATDSLYLFENCLIRSKKTLGAPLFLSVKQNQDPLFKDYSKDDYHLLAGSPAIDAGKDIGITVDLDEKTRTLPPDMGAYEYQ